MLIVVATITTPKMYAMMPVAKRRAPHVPRRERRVRDLVAHADREREVREVAVVGRALLVPEVHAAVRLGVVEVRVVEREHRVHERPRQHHSQKCDRDEDQLALTGSLVRSVQRERPRRPGSRCTRGSRADERCCGSRRSWSRDGGSRTVSAGKISCQMTARITAQVVSHAASTASCHATKNARTAAMRTPKTSPAIRRLSAGAWVPMIRW